MSQNTYSAEADYPAWLNKPTHVDSKKKVTEPLTDLRKIVEVLFRGHQLES